MGVTSYYKVILVLSIFLYTVNALPGPAPAVPVPTVISTIPDTFIPIPVDACTTPASSSVSCCRTVGLATDSEIQPFVSSSGVFVGPDSLVATRCLSISVTLFDTPGGIASQRCVPLCCQSESSLPVSDLSGSPRPNRPIPMISEPGVDDTSLLSNCLPISY